MRRCGNSVNELDSVLPPYNVWLSRSSFSIPACNKRNQ